MRISLSVREKVRQRADNRCEYCRLPEIMSELPHHVDHIIATKHNGSSELNNLAWACFECNVSKGTNIAAYDPKLGILAPLYNPRTQKWDDHFMLRGALIVGKTPIGRTTITILNMNSSAQINARQALINSGDW